MQMSAFSESELDILAGLFVQTAMRVSYAEDEDGESDDDLEMRALGAGLKQVINDEDRPESVRGLAKVAFDSKEKWEIWSHGVFNIEPLCTKAMQLFKTQATEVEAREYGRAVVDVATAVAQAYGEFGIEEDAPSGALDAMMKKIFGRFGRKNESDHPMNVSPAEEACLKNISNALKNA